MRGLNGRTKIDLMHRYTDCLKRKFKKKIYRKPLLELTWEFSEVAPFKVGIHKK